MLSVKTFIVYPAQLCFSPWVLIAATNLSNSEESSFTLKNVLYGLKLLLFCSGFSPTKLNKRSLRRRLRKCIMIFFFVSAFCWQNFVVFSDIASYVVRPHNSDSSLKRDDISVICVQKRQTKIFFLGNNRNME